MTMIRRREALCLILLASYWSQTLGFAALRNPLDMIVLAGAGPSSLIFAYRYLLLNRFSRIRIIEKGPRPMRRSDREGNDFSFGYGLSGRCRAVLDTIPELLERVESISSFTRSDRWVCNRGELCAEILDALDEDFEGRIDLWFDTEVEVFYDDFSVEVVDSMMGERESMKYSLLVAGDGANSAIRNALITKGEIHCTKYLRPISWKALRLPPQPNLVSGAFLPYPRTKEDFGALLPQQDGTFLLLSYWKRQRRRPQMNPWKVEDVQELRNCISQAFPDITEFPTDNVLQTYLEEKPSQEVFLKFNKHAVDKFRVALLGEAAIGGLYSLLGQNGAYAMESADLLARTLAENENLSEVLEMFSTESVAKGDAIQVAGTCLLETLLEEDVASVPDKTMASPLSAPSSPMTPLSSVGDCLSGLDEDVMTTASLAAPPFIDSSYLDSTVGFSGDVPKTILDPVVNKSIPNKASKEENSKEKVRDPDKEPIDPNLRILGKGYMDVLKTSASNNQVTGDWEARYQRWKDRKAPKTTQTDLKTSGTEVNQSVSAPSPSTTTALSALLVSEDYGDAREGQAAKKAPPRGKPSVTTHSKVSSYLEEKKKSSVTDVLSDQGETSPAPAPISAQVPAEVTEPVAVSGPKSAEPKAPAPVSTQSSFPAGAAAEPATASSPKSSKPKILAPVSEMKVALISTPVKQTSSALATFRSNAAIGDAGFGSLFTNLHGGGAGSAKREDKKKEASAGFSSLHILSGCREQDIERHPMSDQVKWDSM